LVEESILTYDFILVENITKSGPFFGTVVKDVSFLDRREQPE